MVSFRLNDETETTLTYLYWPEGDEQQRCGVITVDKTACAVRVERFAPGEFRRPKTQITGPAFYADYAANNIIGAYKNGMTLHVGFSMWNPAAASA